tara:strand:- start:9597 stop:9767 length:171 start_codon:yes stop_codon:yes gene_type:complete
LFTTLSSFKKLIPVFTRVAEDFYFATVKLGTDAKIGYLILLFSKSTLILMGSIFEC